MWKDGSQLPLSHNQEIVGGKVLGHLGKDNNSTGEQEGKRKKIKNFLMLKKIASNQRQSYPAQAMGPAATPGITAAPCSGKPGWQETMPAGTGSLRPALIFWDAGLHRKCSQNMSIQSLYLSHIPTRRWGRFQPSSCLTSSEKPQLSQNESLCLCPITC